jgi:hypothetical protein
LPVRCFPGSVLFQFPVQVQFYFSFISVLFQFYSSGQNKPTVFQFYFSSQVQFYFGHLQLGLAIVAACPVSEKQIVAQFGLLAQFRETDCRVKA